MIRLDFSWLSFLSRHFNLISFYRRYGSYQRVLPSEPLTLLLAQYQPHTTLLAPFVPFSGPSKWRARVVQILSIHHTLLFISLSLNFFSSIFISSARGQDEDHPFTLADPSADLAGGPGSGVVDVLVRVHSETGCRAIQPARVCIPGLQKRQVLWCQRYIISAPTWRKGTDSLQVME